MAHRFRWCILFLTCFIEFGHYYSMDTPASICNYLQIYMESVGGTSGDNFEHKYSLLYSSYCGANLFMPLIAGMVMDTRGERFVMSVFSGCLPLGHLVFALGVLSARWSWMIWGRFIVGVGAESVQMAVHVMLIRWFHGAEVTASQGINLSVARMGSVLVAYLSPLLCASAGISAAVLTGVFVTVAGFVATVGVVLFDSHFEGSEQRRETAPPISLKRIAKLPVLFWLLAAVIVCCYCSVIPFYNICAQYFVQVRLSDVVMGAAQMRASIAMSCMVLVTVVGIPPFGFFVDAVGKRTPLLCCGAAVIACAFAFTSKSSIVTCMLLLGVGYTIFGTIVWAALAQVVPPSQLGCAYGITTVAYNLGLAVTPAFVAWIEEIADWSMVIHSFQAFSLFSLCLTVVLMLTNARYEGFLDWPTAEPKQFDEALKF
mmetsp:Transcript_11319/g.31527  ORF Transcript_11319/g.31527 Transcript_11319/m.31527 type:complete len:429 (-) Transcript_11319:159-1445(-)